VRSLERMLEAVVTEGTAKAAAVPGYPVAGKTGTAEKAIGGTYSPDWHVASFVGFAPARRPLLVGAVVFDEPKGAYHGGEVAAPVFGRIAREALLYLDATPEREPLEAWPGEVAPAPAEPATAPVPEAGGVVLAAAPRNAMPEAEPAVLAAAGPAMPDFSGLTAREAVRRTTGLGLETVLNGRGFVERQDPAAGAPLPMATERIELWLGPGSR
jgi:cell division protein FtsI (penicillin-binding protein 3)